jgi:hypothetical protein
MDDILLMLEDEIESINAVLDARDVEGYIAHLEISRKLHGNSMSEIDRLRVMIGKLVSLRYNVNEYNANLLDVDANTVEREQPPGAAMIVQWKRLTAAAIREALKSPNVTPVEDILR